MKRLHMSVKKRRVNDPGDTGKIDVFRDLEERVLKEFPEPPPGASGFADQPGRSIVEAALASRDVALLRGIAAERKGLTDQQRSALLLVADLLERRAPGRR